MCILRGTGGLLAAPPPLPLGDQEPFQKPLAGDELCVKLLELGMTNEELFGISVKAKTPKVTSLKEFLEVFQKSMNEAINGVKKEL